MLYSTYKYILFHTISEHYFPFPCITSYVKKLINRFLKWYV